MLTLSEAAAPALLLRVTLEHGVALSTDPLVPSSDVSVPPSMLLALSSCWSFSYKPQHICHHATTVHFKPLLFLGVFVPGNHAENSSEKNMSISSLCLSQHCYLCDCSQLHLTEVSFAVCAHNFSLLLLY